MSASIQLRITEGTAKGKVFDFAAHDTFFLGRHPDCHVCLPEDTFVSRHHFILEACPPQACVRDLGSRNGTYVNGRKIGGRKEGESPEEGARRAYPEINLKHGDRIQVGDTALEVRVQQEQKQAGLPAVAPVPSFDELKPQQLADLLLKAAKKGKAPRLNIPGYEIEKELGRGGFGVVFRARRIADGVPVAIKVLHDREQGLRLSFCGSIVSTIDQRRHPLRSGQQSFTSLRPQRLRACRYQRTQGLLGLGVLACFAELHGCVIGFLADVWRGVICDAAHGGKQQESDEESLHGNRIGGSKMKDE
jgi:pSer/pThr/pTyr-binding forkhead associated (FHA) protein